VRMSRTRVGRGILGPTDRGTITPGSVLTVDTVADALYDRPSYYVRWRKQPHDEFGDRFGTIIVRKPER